MTTNNLKYAYNLGLAEDYTQALNDPLIYKQKLDSNKAFRSSLNLYRRQLTFAKDIDSNVELKDKTIASYKNLLLSLAFSLLQRNVQAFDSSLSSLTGYGYHLNSIRKVVYRDQNTEKGYVGTLGYYGQSDMAVSIDYLESLLINYFSTVGQDCLTIDPRTRFLAILSQFNLGLKSDYYLDLQTDIYMSVNNQTVKDKFDSLTLELKDFNNLQSKLYLLELDDLQLSFLDYLYTKGDISLDIYSYRQNYLDFNPVGSVQLYLLALLVEGLVTTIRYLDLTSNDNTLIVNYILDSPNNAQQIAKYLALSYDCSEYLKYSLEEFNLLSLSILNNLKLFLTEPIIANGAYRIDG